MALSPTRAAVAPSPAVPGPSGAADAAREWGPGLRDRLAQAGQPIAAHHGPATAVVAAEGDSGAVAYSVGQTGMLRIFTLTGSQARAPRMRASVRVLGRHAAQPEPPGWRVTCLLQQRAATCILRRSRVWRPALPDGWHTGTPVASARAQVRSAKLADLPLTSLALLPQSGACRQPIVLAACCDNKVSVQVLSVQPVMGFLHGVEA
jgi:hypothetical protein